MVNTTLQTMFFFKNWTENLINPLFVCRAVYDEGVVINILFMFFWKITLENNCKQKKNKLHFTRTTKINVITRGCLKSSTGRRSAKYFS